MNKDFLRDVFSDKNKLNNVSLVMSIIRQESRFDQRGKSPARAQGLMQILPSTAAFTMKNKNYRGKLRHDLLIPEENIKIGEKYISHLIKEPLIDTFFMVSEQGTPKTTPSTSLSIVSSISCTSELLKHGRAASWMRI